MPRGPMIRFVELYSAGDGILTEKSWLERADDVSTVGPEPLKFANRWARSLTPFTDDKLWCTARPCSDCGFGCTTGFLLAESREAAGEARPFGSSVGTSGSISSSSFRNAIIPFRLLGVVAGGTEEVL